VLRALEIESPHGTQRLELSRLTILNGEPCTGKSTILRIIERTFKNIDKLGPGIARPGRKISIKMTVELPQDSARNLIRRLQRSWNIDLSDWDRRVIISTSTERSRYEYVLKISMINEPILHVIMRDNVTAVRRPVDIELKSSPETVRDLVRSIRELPQAHMFSTYEEEICLMSDLIELIVESLRSVRVYSVGPYVDYPTCIDVKDLAETMDSTYVGAHGERTLLVLSRVFADGRAWSSLARLLSYLEKIGLSRVRCGLVEGKLTLTYVLDGELMICPELSCTLRSLIAYYVQILAAERGSIILIDNFDYCMTESACRALIMLLKSTSKNVQLIAEVHDSKLAELLQREGGFASIDVPRDMVHCIKYLR